MFRRLLLLFIAVPIVELAVLIQLGRLIGLWPTLGLIAITGIVGAMMASREGLRAWHAFQTELAQGRMPGRPILDGLSIFAGGALLLTPGLLTDVLGFTLLARPTRRWIQNRVVDRLGGRLMRQGQVFIRTSSDWARSGRAPQNQGEGLGREIGPKDEEQSGGARGGI
ncbi:MAG: FxsA family protein [Gemmatimonadales bacterium]|jgi:UPF0716 protein FxsA